MAGNVFDFTTTRWSLVSSAREGSLEALETLARSYRGPLKAYIQALGYASESDDLVQEFFASRFLRDGFFAFTRKGDQRFRAFLKTCVKHFIIDQKDPRRRRPSPGERPGDLRLEGDPSWEFGATRELAAREAAADEAWDRAWARELLHRARTKLTEECLRANRQRLWEHFERVIDEEPDAESGRSIAADCGMSETAVRVAFHRMRERLKFLLIDEIRETVTNPADWREEQRHLLRVFSAPSPPSAPT